MHPTPSADPATVTAADPALAERLQSVIRDELDKVVPYVVSALKRDRAFDALAERARKAENRLEARRERPVAVALLRLLHRIRHLELDPAVRQSLDAEIVTILQSAGFHETGAVGESFDPAWHEPLDGRTADGAGTVAEVFATGLASFEDVVVRAQVRLVPDQGGDTPPESR